MKAMSGVEMKWGRIWLMEDHVKSHEEDHSKDFTLRAFLNHWKVEQEGNVGWLSFSKISVLQGRL